MSIFKNYYKIYKELEEEVKYYSRECFLKQRRIEQLQKEIKELKKEVNKNDKKNTKRKSTRLSKKQ